MERSVFFKYKVGYSLLHKVPPALKLLLMFLGTVLAFYLPPICALLVWFALILYALFGVHLSVREVLSDMRPAIVYALILYFAQVIASFAAGTRGLSIMLASTSVLARMLKIALSLQITALFYRTTTPAQLHGGLCAIEKKLTRKNTTPFSDSLSLTVTFIPRIASLWKTIALAWKARGGKNSIQRIRTLVPVLFRAAMQSAYQTSLARLNREP